MVSIRSCKNLNPKKNEAKKNTDTHFQQNTLGGGCKKKLLTKLEEGEVSRQAVNSSSREKSEKVKKNFLIVKIFVQTDTHTH